MHNDRYLKSGKASLQMNYTLKWMDMHVHTLALSNCCLAFSISSSISESTVGMTNSTSHFIAINTHLPCTQSYISQ